MSLREGMGWGLKMRLIQHARYFVLQLAESDLTPTLFRQILASRRRRPKMHMQRWPTWADKQQG
jgi:hypothetical protein